MKPAKYNKKLVKSICDLLATGKYSILDTCKQLGVAESTFYYWKRTKPAFAEAIKEAEVRRLESYREMAISGLAKLLDVHEFDEIKVEYENGKDGKPKIKSQTTIKKKIMPNPAAVIFTLTNRDSENWKNRQNTDVTTKGESINSPWLEVLKKSSIKKDDTGED